MKKVIAMTCLILIISSLVAAKVTLPAANTTTLDNGLTVTIVERHELPLFSVRLVFRAGSIYDPSDKAGLANFTSEMLMRGTKTRDAQEIAETISFYGGTLHNFCGREQAGFYGEFLAENGEIAFDVLGDILLHAQLANDEIDKTKTRIAAELESRYEDPSAIANEFIYSRILGGNPYAHLPEGNIASVNSFSRNDAVTFKARCYTPDNCILVVCGDIDKTKITEWVKNYLGGWKGKATLPTINASFAPVANRNILILDKEDATQTQIRIGTIGYSLSNPDFFPMEVARTVFAGSFTSRLMNEIRVKRGLTYGVSLRSSNYDPGGIAFVSTFTKNETVGEVLEIILQEAHRMQSEAVPDSELTGAIKYRSGLYPLSFETNDDLAEAFANVWFHNLDKSFYEDYQEQIKKIGPGQVEKVATKYFPSIEYRIVLVGRADEIKDQLINFGDVEIESLAQH